MLVSDAIQEFLLACGADGLKPATVTWYESILNNFLKGMERREMDQVRAGDVRQYLASLRDRDYRYADARRALKPGKLTDETIHAHTRALHRFWAWAAVEYEMKNPMINIRYPKPLKPKVPKAIQFEDILRLMRACGDSLIERRNLALIAFLADTGCRAAGAVGLEVEHLDLARRRAYVIEKGDELRPVPFSPITALLLMEWIAVGKPTRYVFYSTRTLDRLTVSGLEQMLIRLKAKAKVTGRVNPHSFRHGYAREFIQNGGDMIRLSRLMGHKSTEITAAFYALFTQDELDAAAALFSPLARIKMSPGKVTFEGSG